MSFTTSALLLVQADAGHAVRTPGAISFTTSALLLSWVAILLLALVVSGLVRQVHALTTGAAARRVGPVVGSRAPHYDELAPEVPGPLLVVFAGEGCRTCAELLPWAAEHAARHGAAHPTGHTAEPDAEPVGLTVRAFYPAAVPPDAPRPGGALASVRGSAAELFREYHVVATPYAVLIGADGHVVDARPVGSVDALHALLSVRSP